MIAFDAPWTPVEEGRGMSAPECATCATGPTKRYCAPARCYCGHPDCHAFASWIDMDAIPLADVTTTSSNAWKEREESTWLDKL